MTAGTHPDCRPGCSVGARGDLEAITADLAKGASLRATAAKFKVPPVTLWRHIHNCGPGRLNQTDPAPRGSKLSRRVEDEIVRIVKAGAFAWVAATTAGVTPRTFKRWMARGQEDDEAGLLRSPFRRFYLRVDEARATARAYAETRVARDQPLQWLRAGPGRDRGDPDRPGWTDESIAIRGDSGQAFVLVLKGGGPPTSVPAIDTTARPALTDGREEEGVVDESPDEPVKEGDSDGED